MLGGELGNYRLFKKKTAPSSVVCLFVCLLQVHYFDIY